LRARRSKAPAAPYAPHAGRRSKNASGGSLPTGALREERKGNGARETEEWGLGFQWRAGLGF